MSKLALYRYMDLADDAKEKALQELLKLHIFDYDYVLDKQIGDNAFPTKEDYYKFLLESNDDNFWYKKSGKIAMKTNPLILDGDELSEMGNEERAVVRNRDADLYARKYGFKSWRALVEDFKEQKKMLELKGKIQVKREDTGFTLTVCRNFTTMYWKKRA